MALLMDFSRDRKSTATFKVKNLENLAKKVESEEY